MLFTDASDFTCDLSHESPETQKICNEIKVSQAKYKLSDLLNLMKFNAMENFTNSEVKFEVILEHLSENYESEKFGHLTFELMKYLLKRQQDLTRFIKDLRFCLGRLKKVSLRELIYNLLLNSDFELRVKIFQLLHNNNPVPFSNYFLSPSSGVELQFHSEVNWIMDKSHIKILSFSLESNCKGKTRLINKIFKTTFEESIKSSFFNGTIDMQIIKNYGGYNICLADAHGVLDLKVLEKILPLFAGVIIQVKANSTDSSEKMLELFNRIKS